MRRRLFILFIALALGVAACGDNAAESGGDVGGDAGAPAAEQEATNEGEGAQEPDDNGGFTRSDRDSSPLPDTEEPTDTGEPPLDAAPQRIEFQAEDGKGLVGYYLPAAMNPAPAIVLMHWAGGDQRDWIEIGPWLQNRPGELPPLDDIIGPDCGPQLEGPWLDPSWFPVFPEGLSFAVFIFDFRDFCESEAGLTDPSEWALDAKAAFDTVATLEGVDAGRIVGVGASIGADGAADGCVLHNLNASTCLGAFSLSPGNYLQGVHYPQSYAETVDVLDGAPPPIPAWCLAAEGDTISADTCRSASGEAYVMQIYPGDLHGMRLVTPELELNSLILLQDFLEVVFGLSIN
jgi:hypothetical protein